MQLNEVTRTWKNFLVQLKVKGGAGRPDECPFNFVFRFISFLKSYYDDRQQSMIRFALTCHAKNSVWNIRNVCHCHLTINYCYWYTDPEILHNNTKCNGTVLCVLARFFSCVNSYAACLISSQIYGKCLQAVWKR